MACLGILLVAFLYCFDICLSSYRVRFAWTFSILVILAMSHVYKLQFTNWKIYVFVSYTIIYIRLASWYLEFPILFKIVFSTIFNQFTEFNLIKMPLDTYQVFTSEIKCQRLFVLIHLVNMAHLRITENLICL